MANVQMEPSWLNQLKDEFDKDYMKNLKSFLKKEYESGKTIYPPKSKYFEAFKQTPFDQVKVVIVGQDPYHGPKQAHGLSFSVPEGLRLPPSLLNIFKELRSDLDSEKNFSSGYLLPWAQQGVLLLNSTLTVEAGRAGSHQKKGWEVFTDEVLKKLNSQDTPIVFILWGSYAQKKGDFINGEKHLVLKAPHPSPLSAYRGFFGSRPFSQANNFLQSNGRGAIDWLDV